LLLVAFYLQIAALFIGATPGNVWLRGWVSVKSVS
jgi:hypothetical protein